MGRPRNDSDQAAERRLTFAICSYIYSTSGLTHAALDRFFGLGEEHPTIEGARTGRTFARYCYSPELVADGRTASRDALKRFVELSILQGWIKTDFLETYSQFLGRDLHFSD